MELKEFIKTSITQISEALIESNNELKEKGCVVNPKGIRVNSKNSKSYGRESKEHKHESKIVQSIDFDIAVTVQDSKEGAADAKIAVLSLKLGGEASASSSNISESRIKFCVPIIYPEGND